MFGHIHVLDHWLKEGVQYIISGNSAKKGYVSHEKGNVLGYGLLHINQEEISYEYKPYIDELHIVHKNKKVHEINLKVGEERRLHTYITVKKLDRKSTRLNSSHVAISYAVFCLNKK